MGLTRPEVDIAVDWAVGDATRRIPPLVDLAARDDGARFGARWTARRLWRGPALAAACGSGPLFVDPPEPNAAAIAMVERYGFKPVFETARMYTGETPDIPLTSVFGVTSFEFG